MQLPSEEAADGAPQRIVVGVDGSAGARAALAWALAEAARRESELLVVSAVSVDFYWDDAFLHADGGLDRVSADTETRARTLIDEVRQDPAVVAVPGSSGVPVTVTVAVGPAADALVDEADDADLLVVGSRGRGAARSTVMGSVALHCVTHARCPVVVVHPSRAAMAGAGAVVVGLDDSEPSRAALRVALAEAACLGAEVEAVVAYEPLDTWGELYTLAGTVPHETGEHAQARGEQIVSDVLGGVTDGSGPRVRVVAVEGPPGPVLTRRAEDAALLVVGSRSRSRLRGLLLGSVALNCVVSGPGPVMVVRSEGAARQPDAAPAPA